MVKATDISTWDPKRGICKPKPTPATPRQLEIWVRMTPDMGSHFLHEITKKKPFLVSRKVSSISLAKSYTLLFIKGITKHGLDKVKNRVKC